MPGGHSMFDQPNVKVAMPNSSAWEDTMIIYRGIDGTWVSTTVAVHLCFLLIEAYGVIGSCCTRE